MAHPFSVIPPCLNAINLRFVIFFFVIQDLMIQFSQCEYEGQNDCSCMKKKVLEERGKRERIKERKI